MNARERAASYLNIKPRTKYQVIKYLESKEYDTEEIMEAVKELEEYHYIDDEAYCRLYFEMGFEKGRGIYRIKRELAERGVPDDIIEDVYSELEEVPDQLEMAVEIGRKVIGRIDTESLEYEEKRKLQAKIGRRIVSRGFSSEVAYKVMNLLVK